jgi:hypothetical protein
VDSGYFVHIIRRELIIETHLRDGNNFLILKLKKIRGLSPQANNIDRATAKLVPIFADRGRRVVSATDPRGRILGFLDRRRYYFFQVTHQLFNPFIIIIFSFIWLSGSSYCAVLF